MKSKRNILSRFSGRTFPAGILLPVFTGVLLSFLPATHAASVYWDSNGSVAGAGNPANGSWGSTNIWNTDSTGGAGTFSSAVGAANDAFFSAGSDAINPFTVTVVGNNAANSVSFEEGTPTLNGGSIALTKATSSSGLGGSFGTAITLAGTATVNSGINIDATGTGNPLLKLIVNNGAGDPDLTLAGPITRSGTLTFGIRPGGAGSARISSSLADVNGTIEGLAVSPAWNGPLTIAGNQAMTTSFFFRSTTAHGAGAQLIFGDGLSDIQSWSGLSIDNATPTLAALIRSTATMTGGLTISRGAKAQIKGALNCLGTLTLGNASGVGTLQLSDGVTAGKGIFGGLSVFAFPGSTILGGAPAMSTLTFSNNSAASVTANLTIGGGGDNDNIQLNKQGSGTLTLGGSHSYVGATVVSGGRLDLTGTIVSSVSVSNNASLGGEGSTTGSIAFGSGTSSLFFDPVTAGVLTANTISASGVVIVNPSSSTSGVVMQSTTTPNGITGTVGVNYVSGARGNLTLNGAADTLSFTPTSAASLKWRGNASNPTFWDVITTTNWSNGGNTDRFYSGDSVLFDDSASSYSVAIQNGSVAPGNTVISNNANAYTISSGSIIGTGALTKNGSGSATILSGGHNFSGGLTVNNGTLSLLGAANTFTGGVTNNGGSLIISNINQIGATGGGSSLNSINLNGGKLSYSGPTITSDTLIINLLGGTSTIEISDTNNFTLRTGAAVTGSGNLIKSGPGTLALGKNNVQTPVGNTFTGKITVTGGQLDIRQQDSLGDVSGITEFTNGTLYIDPFGQPSGMTFDPEPMVFSGNSFIRNFNQGTTASQVDVLTGPLTNNGTLGIFSQTNGAYGELQINGNMVNGPGAVLSFGANNAGVPNTQNQIVTVSGIVSGPASVSTEGGSGSVYTLANNNYSGNTTVTGGTLVLQQATLATNSDVVVATGAVLKLDFGAVTNTINSLKLGGVSQNPGVYDATSGAPFITGAGSLLVTALPMANYSTNITASVSGNTLTLTWPSTHLGWFLQSQTNTLSVGLTTPSNTWFDVSGSDAATSKIITINPANPSVFYRLRHP